MTPLRYSKKFEIDVLPVHCQSSNDLLLNSYMKRVDILSIRVKILQHNRIKVFRCLKHQLVVVYLAFTIYVCIAIDAAIRQ